VPSAVFSQHYHDFPRSDFSVYGIYVILSEIVYSAGVHIFLNSIQWLLEGYIAYMGEKINAHHILVGKS
jgi:hypothetical protein